MGIVPTAPGSPHGFRKIFSPALPDVNGESFDSLEDTLLAGMAGARASGPPDRIVQWEGRRYRLNPSRAEEMRLHRVRQRQGGASLQAALLRAQQAQKAGGDKVLADTLVSILYAAYLGDPRGPALAADNVALRHDLGATGVMAPRTAWRLPTEGHSGKGWRVSGSLLGLDVALARLSLRRLDANVMPPEPRIVSAERQTASLTVSLLNPLALSDAARDEIAAALARGRARLDALDASEAEVDQAARDAGLSAWRREALRWTIAHDGANRAAQLSLVELMWLGRPRAAATLSLDGWGAAMLPFSGCVCLSMPAAQPMGGPERPTLARAPGHARRRRLARRCRHACRARAAGTDCTRRDCLRHAGGPRSGAPCTLRRLVRVQPRRERADARQPRRLHCRADCGRCTPAADSRRRPPPGSVTQRTHMAHRLLLLTLAVVADVALSAQPPPLTVRITSPVDDGYVSGLFRLVAVVEPAGAAKLVKEVVFFADGRKICTLSREPFQCDWDAGDRVIEHTIRVTVEHVKGGRTATTVQTKGVKYSEAVDVDVVQFTAVVTDGDGRFVRGLKPTDFKVYDNNRLQKITSFESENISLEMVVALDVSSSMRAALPRVKESAKRFLAGLRAGDQVTLLGFNDNVFIAGAAQPRSVGARQGHRSHARVGRHGPLRRRPQRSESARSSSRTAIDAPLQRWRRPVQPRHAASGSRPRRRQRRDHLRDWTGSGYPCADLQTVLKKFATISGGRAFFAEDVSRLDRFFEEILEDLSNQYLISYNYPDTERDGQLHQIRAEVADGKYHVRAREGYRLAKD